MLKKRLVGVVTVKQGWAVQSFGYHRYLPLGKVECLVENLDRWGADEILVQVIDRFDAYNTPDFELLEGLARLGLKTPLIYGGGIRTVADGVRVIQSGADRLLIDALLHDSLSVVEGLADHLGAQAVIASMPMAMEQRQLVWYDYRSRTSNAIGDEVLAIIGRGVVSEVLLTDWQHEGQPKGFDPWIIQSFPLKDISLIAFGGLSDPDLMAELLRLPNLSAVAVGNFLSYREHAIQLYKEALAGTPMRSSIYESESSLLDDH